MYLKVVEAVFCGSNDRMAIIERSMGNPSQGKVGVRDVSSKLNEAGYSGKVDIFDGDVISQAARDGMPFGAKGYSLYLIEGFSNVK